MIATLTVFVAFALAGQDQAEVPVKNVSAGYIVELMTQTGQFEQETPSKSLTTGASLVPKGVTIELTPGHNSITVIGPLEGVREMAMLIPQFDVVPKAVAIEIEAEMPHFSRKFRAATTMYSNSRWDYKDRRLESKLSVVPRVNTDGSVTLGVTCGNLGYSMSVVVRLKPGQTLFGRLYAGQTMDEKPALLLDYSVPPDFPPKRKRSGTFTGAAQPQVPKVERLTHAAPEELEFVFQLTVVVPDRDSSK